MIKFFNLLLLVSLLISATSGSDTDEEFDFSFAPLAIGQDFNDPNVLKGDKDDVGSKVSGSHGEDNDEFGIFQAIKGYYDEPGPNEKNEEDNDDEIKPTEDDVQMKKEAEDNETLGAKPREKFIPPKSSIVSSIESILKKGKYKQQADEVKEIFRDPMFRSLLKRTQFVIGENDENVRHGSEYEFQIRKFIGEADPTTKLTTTESTTTSTTTTKTTTTTTKPTTTETSTTNTPQPKISPNLCPAQCFLSGQVGLVHAHWLKELRDRASKEYLYITNELTQLIGDLFTNSYIGTNLAEVHVDHFELSPSGTVLTDVYIHLQNVDRIITDDQVALIFNQGLSFDSFLGPYKVVESDTMFDMMTTTQAKAVFSANSILGYGARESKSLIEPEVGFNSWATQRILVAVGVVSLLIPITAFSIYCYSKQSGRTEMNKAREKAFADRFLELGLEIGYEESAHLSESKTSRHPLISYLLAENEIRGTVNGSTRSLNKVDMRQKKYLSLPDQRRKRPQSDSLNNLYSMKSNVSYAPRGLHRGGSTSMTNLSHCYFNHAMIMEEEPVQKEEIKQKRKKKVVTPPSGQSVETHETLIEGGSGQTKSPNPSSGYEDFKHYSDVQKSGNPAKIRPRTSTMRKDDESNQRKENDVPVVSDLIHLSDVSVDQEQSNATIVVHDYDANTLK